MKQEEKNRRSRELIEVAAIHAFARQGLDNANLNQLCRENGISKGKLYHYYESKEQLIVACAQRIVDRLEADVRAFQVDPEKDIAGNLHAYYDERIRFWRTHPEAFVFIRHCQSATNSQLREQLSMESLVFSMGMKDKVLEIIHASGARLAVADADMYSTMRVMYDYLLVVYMHKVVDLYAVGDTAGADREQQALLDHYDRLIYILLHGILA